MTRAGKLELTLETLPGETAVVRVDGELDLATVPDLERVIANVAPSRRLVFDLSRCTFLDSSGLRVILAAAQSARDGGGAVSLVARSDNVLRVLEISTIDTHLPVHPSLEEALGRP